MLKRILIKAAFKLVIEFVCTEARQANKPWVKDFCDFAKQLESKI